ncbi:hypothetical protein D3C76_1749870 [compost metagenome]
MITSIPLIAPSSAPNSKPPRIIASQNGQPLIISLAVTIPVSASIEPTDKSIPAIRMVKKTPQANSTITELCTRIWLKLLPVRK